MARVCPLSVVLPAAQHDDEGKNDTGCGDGAEEGENHVVAGVAVGIEPAAEHGGHEKVGGVADDRRNAYGGTGYGYGNTGLTHHGEYQAVQHQAEGARKQRVNAYRKGTHAAGQSQNAEDAGGEESKQYNEEFACGVENLVGQVPAYGRKEVEKIAADDGKCPDSSTETPTTLVR